MSSPRLRGDFVLWDNAILADELPSGSIGCKRGARFVSGDANASYTASHGPYARFCAGHRTVSRHRAGDHRAARAGYGAHFHCILPERGTGLDYRRPAAVLRPADYSAPSILVGLLAVLVSLFGWFLALRGVLLLASPQLIERAGQHTSVTGIRIGFAVLVLAGLWLTYTGWVARSQ
jgi:hypothetical protein